MSWVNAIIVGSIVTEGKGVHTLQNTTDLSANTTQTVLSIPPGKSIEIIELQFASDSRTATSIRLHIRGSDNTTRILRSLAHNGAGTVDRFNVSNVTQFGSSFFQVLNDTSGGYKIGLTRPLIFPNGLEIERINTSSESSHKAGFYIVYREVN